MNVALWESLNYNIDSLQTVDLFLCDSSTPVFSDGYVFRYSCKEEEKKALVGSPLSIFWAIWKERDRAVFEDAPFSHIRLKHSIISSLLYWAGIIPNVDISFVRTLPSLYMTDPRS